MQSQLPKLQTLLSTQIRNILTHFERVHGQTLPLTIIRQNMDGMEIEFANALVEDSNNDALSYTDCECLTFCVTFVQQSEVYEWSHRHGTMTKGVIQRLTGRSDDDTQIHIERYDVW